MKITYVDPIILPRNASHYSLLQSQCGIQRGDMVVVISKAQSKANGWDNTWVERMDDTIGGTFRVDNVGDNCGIRLDINGGGSFRYPFFVLRKVQP